jgi:hypothetical protein
MSAGGSRLSASFRDDPDWKIEDYDDDWDPYSAKLRNREAEEGGPYLPARACARAFLA